MEVELPFKVEYAKSGRASCKGCKTNIGQGSLRIAAMVRSRFHDGKQPNWFHESCFFKKQRPASAGDVENYENLRFEDQERLRKKIDEICSVVTATKGKSSKRTKAESTALKDFGIEYAASGRATCRGCEQKILKDQVRIRKTVYDTEVGMKYGGQPLWHHVECFAQLRNELGWLEKGDALPGFNSLTSDDKDVVKKALPAIKSEGGPPSAKQPKLESKGEGDITGEEAALAKQIKQQMKRMFEFRDNCHQCVSKREMIELLEWNNQQPVSGDSEKLLDQLADMLTFGAIKPCPECGGQQMLFHKSGYICNGQLTEWTKCAKLYAKPERKACKIPSELKQKFAFLKSVKKEPETRTIRYIPPSASTTAKNIKKEDEVDGPKVKRERPPLYNFAFARGGLKSQETELRAHLAKLGATLTSKVTENTMAVISTAEEVKRMGSLMSKAKSLGLHVVPIEYIEAVEKNHDGALQYLSSMTLCDWGTDPSARIPKEEAKSMKSKSIYTKSVPKSVTLKLKGGLAVDPDSGLEDVAHVLVRKNDKYSVVLGLTDLQRNKNSYYKLQLLVSDNEKNFWLFRSWGRIGTTIGDNRTERYDSLMSAIEAFNSLYLDKTGNEFCNRHNFVKVPGRMYPIDIEYADDEKIQAANEANSKFPSKLHSSVQSLIKLIFDIETMKRTMMEFHLDMEKMPLGKLSQKQIQSAYKVLSEIYELIEKKGSNSAFIDASNRFYTLIPHNFGVEHPPLLDSLKQVESLRQMLDSLMEIECAYNLLKTEDTKEEANPLDKHYEQLKADIQPLDKESEEFSLIKQYVENTHAETHTQYELEIVDVFKLSRQGESRRYKPFKKLHNRKLLWHGSRLTNFVGILSHGLKIAPPEAPVTGYMFGKGIYFADMVSKSANYCCTSSENSTGLMLLSEVALGDMLECTTAKYVTKLPKDKHSCFGRGRTQPNPKESYVRKDGVEIPLGKSVTDANLQSSLLYNEYIVYDIAQVNIQYLLRMNFKYKF